VLFAGTSGNADNVPVERTKKWEADLLRYLSASHPEIGRDIAEKKQITPETEQKLREALSAFEATWQ
jgi:F-type H+-transporting ATPase subunit alpha